MPTKESFDIDGLMVFRSDLTAVDQDGNTVASVITPDRYVQNWREPATDEQIGRLTNTTAYWRENNTYIPRKGEVIIYSDGSTTEQGGVTVNIPKIKVGDGVTTVGNLPFTDSDTQQGTAGTLDTTNTSSQTPVASESLSGNVNLHKVSKTGSYDDLLNKPTIPTVPTNVSDFVNDAGYITENDIPAQEQSNWEESDINSPSFIKGKPSIPSELDDLDDVVVNNVSGGDILTYRAGKTSAFINVPLSSVTLPASTKYAASISLSIDSSTFVITAQLLDQDGNNLGNAQTIDLPLESVVVSGSYNAQTKKVVLTLQNGSTIEFSVADLVAGLQSEITAQNPLNADLIVDGTTNKVFTLTMKTKLDGIEAGAEVNVQSDWDETDTSSDAYILHKPTLFSGDYNDLTNKPTIPAAQVNSDWNANSGVAQILNKPDLNATLYESVTYSQLVTKISNSQLVKGRKYRITDYVTTTTQTNTSSAGHVFDLVVTAIDVNELDHRASALLHNGDTYFSTAGADLGKWQVWYDVNNDTSKYLWADSTNGKGVIYRMIDEWGNDCPYDFKNILFTKANSYTSAYTFNKFTSGDTANSDYSLNIQYRNCYENIICAYYKVYGGVNKRNLNFNVFLTTDSTSKCSSNTFECDCYNNTFGDGCSRNTFLSTCYNNTFSDNCRHNVFGSYCNSNTFGNNCFDNSFGTDCSSNKFGNYCYTITLENRCGAIVLGNSSNQGGSYIINVTIKSGNSYVRIYNTTSPSDSNYLKNIYIAQGCSGTSNAYTEISTIARNLSYRTTVGRDSSGNIRIYNEDDPASASQAQANWNETSSSSPSYIQNKPTLTTITFRHW